MRGTILLNYNENTHQVEDEEKARFIRGFLEQCFEDAPDVSSQISSIWEADGPLPVQKKIRLRGILTTYGIQIEDDLDGHLDIYLENEKVAEWYKPSYKLKRDFSQRNRKKQLYIEMFVECWSIFEGQNEQEESD